MAVSRRGRSARPLLIRGLHGLAVALALALGVQLMRFILALATAHGPVGDPMPPMLSASSDAVALRFDPFFRASGEAGSGTVTALPLKLFGTRMDVATGGGSAIIATPDGLQSSFVAGETIMPGAKLARVATDHVEIERNGARERLYLDQSVPAAPLAPPAVMVPAPAAPAMPAVTPPPAGLANESAGR